MMNGTKQYSKFQLFVITYLSARELIENPKALREAENRVRMSIQEFSRVHREKFFPAMMTKFLVNSGS
jgi:hypothetical protein